jgi:hypothetical protein
MTDAEAKAYLDEHRSSGYSIGDLVKRDFDKNGGAGNIKGHHDLLQRAHQLRGVHPHIDPTYFHFVDEGSPEGIKAQADLEWDNLARNLADSSYDFAGGNGHPSYRDSVSKYGAGFVSDKISKDKMSPEEVEAAGRQEAYDIRDRILGQPGNLGLSESIANVAAESDFWLPMVHESVRLMHRDSDYSDESAEGEWAKASERLADHPAYANEVKQFGRDSVVNVIRDHDWGPGQLENWEYNHRIDESEMDRRQEFEDLSDVGNDFANEEADHWEGKISSRVASSFLASEGIDHTMTEAEAKKYLDDHKGSGKSIGDLVKGKGGSDGVRSHEKPVVDEAWHKGVPAHHRIDSNMVPGHFKGHTGNNHPVATGPLVNHPRKYDMMKAESRSKALGRLNGRHGSSNVPWMKDFGLASEKGMVGDLSKVPNVVADSTGMLPFESGEGFGKHNLKRSMRWNDEVANGQAACNAAYLDNRYDEDDAGFRPSSKYKADIAAAKRHVLPDEDSGNDQEKGVLDHHRRFIEEHGSDKYADTLSKLQRRYHDAIMEKPEYMQAGDHLNKVVNDAVKTFGYGNDDRAMGHSFNVH